MATAITTQPTGPKRLGTVKLVDPAKYSSGEKIDMECWASPVPKNKLRPGSKADLAVDVCAGISYGSIHGYEFRVELEDDSSNSYVGHEYEVFVTDQYMGIPRPREYMLAYNHKSKATFDHDPIPLTVAVEQMIGAALYYLFIDSKQDDSSSAEIPTFQQWLEEWHEIIQKNVCAQMAQFNPARG